MTRGEMLRRMTSAEFAEWMAYDRVQPFGADRDDWRFGQLGALIANALRKKDAGPVKPSDFMWSELTREKPKPDLRAKFRQVFAGKIKGK